MGKVKDDQRLVRSRLVFFLFRRREITWPSGACNQWASRVYAMLYIMRLIIMVLALPPLPDGESW
jgi:hypothetical protein